MGWGTLGLAIDHRIRVALSADAPIDGAVRAGVQALRMLRARDQLWSPSSTGLAARSSTSSSCRTKQQTAGVDLVVLDQGIYTSTAVIPVLVDGAAMPALTGA